MATLRTFGLLTTVAGGEEKRFTLDRSLTIDGDVVTDLVATIIENTSGSPVTLWQAAGHGLASPTSEFLRGAVLVDPDESAASSLPVDIELGFTSAAGAVTTRVIRLTAEGVLSLEPVAGASFSAMTDRLTRVRAANPAAAGSPAGSNNRRIRLLLLK